MAAVEPTHIAIDQPVLDRIARRVADAHLGYAPDDDAGWRYGTDAAYLRELRDYWRDSYDWRAAEAAFNRHEQYRTEIDGISIHFFRFRPEGGDGYPLILTHGWPGSPLEFMEAAPLLAKQGYDVIVPSLPGYGFSGRPPRPYGPRKVAALWRKLMVDALGFTRFGAQGGDWGSAVTRYLGHEHGDVTGAIHLNMMPLTVVGEPTEEDKAWQQRMMGLQMMEGAYGMIHGTKPQTIGLALADTPVGFAGWVVEKCRSWSDCGGDVESVFSKDALLTNIMTYLVTDNVQGGVWMYNGMGINGDAFAAVPVTVPTGFADYPAEFIPPSPRASAEKGINLVRWTKMAKGGHFAAWEQPALFVEDVAAFFAEYR